MDNDTMLASLYTSKRRSKFRLPFSKKFFIWLLIGIGIFLLLTFGGESLDVGAMQAYTSTKTSINVITLAKEVDVARQREEGESSIVTNDNRRFIAYCQNEYTGIDGDYAINQLDDPNTDEVEGCWANDSTYPGGSIKLNGCGICASAMILAYHTQDFLKYNPRTVNNESKAASIQCPSDSRGSIVDIFNTLYEDVGLEAKLYVPPDILTKAKMDEVLDQGGYIIINKRCQDGRHDANPSSPRDNDRCGLFCTVGSNVGHYICIYKHNEDDTYYVGNSNGSCASHYEYKFSATNLEQTATCEGYWYAILPVGAGGDSN